MLFISTFKGLHVLQIITLVAGLIMRTKKPFKRYDCVCRPAVSKRVHENNSVCFISTNVMLSHLKR